MSPLNFDTNDFHCIFLSSTNKNSYLTWRDSSLCNQSKFLFDLQRQFSLQPIKILIWPTEIVFSLQPIKILIWPAETALSSTNQNSYLTWRDSSLFNQSKLLFDLERQFSLQPTKILIWPVETPVSPTNQIRIWPWETTISSTNNNILIDWMFF